MTQFKKMVFKLDPDNREEEGKRVEQYLKGLGYTDDSIGHISNRLFICTEPDDKTYYYARYSEAKTFEPIPTDYQVAVAQHMEGAPEELAEYVRGRLVLGGDDSWGGNTRPIRDCGFDWGKSQERRYFWEEIDYKCWEEAMSTNFWKSYTEQNTEQNPEEEERPKGVVGNWYTLTSNVKKWVNSKYKEAGYTWRCEEVDSYGEPMIDGICIARDESYRKATPEEIVETMEKELHEKVLFGIKADQREALTKGSYAKAIKAEYDRLSAKQVAKNSDYGDSAFEDIYLMGNTITAKQACIARMSDKIKRLQSTNLKVDESFFDTLDDLIGYIVVYNILNKR